MTYSSTGWAAVLDAMFDATSVVGADGTWLTDIEYRSMRSYKSELTRAEALRRRCHALEMIRKTHIPIVVPPHPVVYRRQHKGYLYAVGSGRGG